MKKHGLWQWHRAIRQHLKSVNWWEVDFKNDSYALKELRHAIYKAEYFGAFSKPEVIRVCANRYVRRFMGGEYTIQQWNELVSLIGERNGSHRNTIKSCRINPVSAKMIEGTVFIKQDGEDFEKSAILTDWKIRKIELVYQNAQRVVEEETQGTRSIYCELNERTSNGWSVNRCCICGAIYPRTFLLKNAKLPSGSSTDEYVYTMRKHVCNNELCRYLGYKQPIKKRYHDDVSTISHLIGVLNECTKRKGDNEIYRGLAKHIARNPGAVRQWASRSHTREDGGKNV